MGANLHRRRSGCRCLRYSEDPLRTTETARTTLCFNTEALKHIVPPDYEKFQVEPAWWRLNISLAEGTRRLAQNTIESCKPLHSKTLALLAIPTGLCLWSAATPGVDEAAFQRAVRPVIAKNCVACHNEALASGGVNLVPYTSPASVATDRLAWEKILQKLRSGEMPPKGAPRPTLAATDAFVHFFDAEWEKADRNTAPDPGRVTARRLNRTEYSNTVRDLLGLEFRAEEDFPTDDLGEGFDNIADVLSISPLLMEKYVAAAEKIAARAVGNVTLPEPVTASYEAKEHNLTRIDVDTIEATHHIDFDGDYDLTIGLPGARSKTAKPVQLALWMDGKLLHQEPVETKPSDLVYFSPFSDARFRLTLPEGQHTFRVGFLDDDFVATLPEKNYYTQSKNKYPGSITFSGPFASKTENLSRKRIFTCDPNTGAVCTERVVNALARRAYRRPVTKAETASLMKLVALAKSNGEAPEQGVQLALQAILVSPNFLFRIERDPFSSDPAKVHRITDLELASRLSYFLWSSTPDENLLSTAEANKLHTPAVLDAQVKRMLADPKSAALADNFAGQWLEIRNLDSIKPDPDKFLLWGPELKNAMKSETSLFVDYILKNNRPMSDFLDARYTFLNERLAKFYGISGVTGPEFRRVQLATNQRGGILAQASVLTVSSYPTRTSPTIRGKYVLNNILGSPPPPPPPDVPALDASKVGSEVSLRKQLEEHRSNPVCASCHSKMDVLGFGLDNYNAIGKWRTQDGKFPIEAGGTLPGGKEFHTPAELRTILVSELPEFAHCLTEKMMTYALGRGIQPYDRPTVRAIDERLKANNYPFQDLIFETIHSLPFQSRRAEIVTTKLAPALKETAHR